MLTQQADFSLTQSFLFLYSKSIELSWDFEVSFSHSWMHKFFFCYASISYVGSAYPVVGTVNLRGRFHFGITLLFRYYQCISLILCICNTNERTMSNSCIRFQLASNYFPVCTDSVVLLGYWNPRDTAVRSCDWDAREKKKRV